jgi:hypothetical protein
MTPEQWRKLDALRLIELALPWKRAEVEEERAKVLNESLDLFRSEGNLTDNR